MHQSSAEGADQLENAVLNQKRSGYEDDVPPTGTTDALKRALAAHRLSDMLDCIKEMKSHAHTIEKDLPDYLRTLHINGRTGETTVDSLTDDFLRLDDQASDNPSYILLNDLWQQTTASKDHPQRSSTIPAQDQSELQTEISAMRRIIAAQPSALEGIYLEALLNPDQWQQYHGLLRNPPADGLSVSERKRLDELLKEKRKP